MPSRTKLRRNRTLFVFAGVWLLALGFVALQALIPG